MNIKVYPADEQIVQRYATGDEIEIGKASESTTKQHDSGERGTYGERETIGNCETDEECIHAISSDVVCYCCQRFVLSHTFSLSALQSKKYDKKLFAHLQLYMSDAVGTCSVVKRCSKYDKIKFVFPTIPSPTRTHFISSPVFSLQRFSVREI